MKGEISRNRVFFLGSGQVVMFLCPGAAGAHGVRFVYADQYSLSGKPVASLRKLIAWTV